MIFPRWKKSQACISVQLFPILGFAFSLLHNNLFGFMKFCWMRAGGVGDTRFPLCSPARSPQKLGHRVMTQLDPPPHTEWGRNRTAIHAKAKLQAPADNRFYWVFYREHHTGTARTERTVSLEPGLTAQPTHAPNCLNASSWEGIGYRLGLIVISALLHSFDEAPEEGRPSALDCLWTRPHEAGLHSH